MSYKYHIINKSTAWLKMTEKEKKSQYIREQNTDFKIK